MSKTVLVIAGPTAVGKTAVAVSVAKHFNTEIISADSRQCYRELNIGVAKPSPGELGAVHHYFINSHSIHETVTAASFEQYALDAAAAIFAKKDIAVIVGGTGLYVKAFCEGLDPIPPIPTATREKYTRIFEEGGTSLLQQHIQKADPVFSEKGEMQNPQRLMRALEVMETTGKSILTYQTGEKKKREFNIIKVCLDLPRTELYHRIDTRVDNMMLAGLEAEAMNLLPYRSYNALQTVGYSELFEHFDGKLTVDQAVDAIKQHTRNYAKRQITWFKKDPAFKLVSPADPEAIINTYKP